MKKFLCLLCLCMAFSLSACGKDEGEDVAKPQTEIKENSVYAAPVNPSHCQVELYNKLTKALGGSDDEKIASLVAANFVADFFTLKNKETAHDVGGLVYLPEAIREAFVEYAEYSVYSNYEAIKLDFGSSSLPEVKEVKIGDITATTVTYDNFTPANEELGTPATTNPQEYDGYEVTLTLTYEKTELKDEDLKTEVTVVVMNYDGTYYVKSIA